MLRILIPNMPSFSEMPNRCHPGQDPVEGLGQYYKSIMMKKSLGTSKTLRCFAGRAVSNEKQTFRNVVFRGFVGDDQRTRLCEDYNKALEGFLLNNQDSMESKARFFLWLR